MPASTPSEVRSFQATSVCQRAECWSTSAKKAGQRVHLVGGGTEVVSFAKGAQILMDGRRSDHPDLACFENWGEVQEYVAFDEQGGDLRLLVKLVEEFTVPVILEALDSNTPEGRADVIVSTAHKSKGREWHSVQLGSDFPDEPGEEELRLLYVGSTRAKINLDNTAVVAAAPAAVDAAEKAA